MMVRCFHPSPFSISLLSIFQVHLRSKDSDPSQWRVHTSVEGSDVTVKLPGELTSFKLTSLDRDSFYDVTVEAVVKGQVVGTARKICKTDDKRECYEYNSATS